jgi:hypothetical protein
MSDVTDLTTRRARLIAVGFMNAYQRQRDTMRIAGVPSSELAPGDDGETVVADVAACLTVAASLPRAGLTAPVLRRMSIVEEPAFAALARAARAYFGSRRSGATWGRRPPSPSGSCAPRCRRPDPPRRATGRPR